MMPTKSILEDSAEALGSSAKGKKCGTSLGILGFVFNGNKINTSGGGAIVTRNEGVERKSFAFCDSIQRQRSSLPTQ
jgi:dTDP-4-amino-4,6-dideoxygalactose transaminase